MVSHTSIVVYRRRRCFIRVDTRSFESVHTMHFDDIQHHDFEHTVGAENVTMF